MNGREWTFADLDGIAQLEQECFPVEPWNRRMLADSLLTGRFVTSLLEEEGAITAYGGMSVLDEEGEIGLIATAEMYRGCGRGSKVLEDLLDGAKAHGVKKVFLEVRVSNAPAMLLYLRHGFTGLYARSRYYPDGEDALVMVKEIT